MSSTKNILPCYLAGVFFKIFATNPFFSIFKYFIFLKTKENFKSFQLETLLYLLISYSFFCLVLFFRHLRKVLKMGNNNPYPHDPCYPILLQLFLKFNCDFAIPYEFTVGLCLIWTLFLTFKISLTSAKIYT